MSCELRKKALFLDRDGVINIDNGYVSTPEDCILIDGILDFLQKAKEKNYLILVITNQSGIGRGFYNENDFHFLMNWLNKNLNYLIDDYYFCPFHEKFGVGKYKQKSYKRKPNPGMINDAINDYNIDPQASIFIGDKLTDMVAASRAKVRCKLLLNDKNFAISKKYILVKTLNEAKKYLL